MTTNKSFLIKPYRQWSCLPSGVEVCFYKNSNEKIVIYRSVMMTSSNGKIIRKYGYGLRSDDCRHTKRFIMNAIKHYFYVKEIVYGI